MVKEIWLIIKEQGKNQIPYVVMATTDEAFAKRKMEEYKADFIQTQILFEDADVKEMEEMRNAKKSSLG